ncbi:MAG: hypothetical protein Q8P12_04260 [bacterium]|nr:hypothetical protein [bacterium]
MLKKNLGREKDKVDLRDFIGPDAPFVISAIFVVVAALVIAVIWFVVVMTASTIAGLAWGHRARRRVELALIDDPIDAIDKVFSWPKRQINRLQFYREFGFKPWKFHRLSDEQRQIISAKLSLAADALDQAFARKDELEHGDRFAAVTVAALKGAKLHAAEAKKRFWHLHWLAGRIGGQNCNGWRSDKQMYARCSYQKHLTQPFKVRRAS